MLIKASPVLSHKKNMQCISCTLTFLLMSMVLSTYFPCLTNLNKSQRQRTLNQKLYAGIKDLWQPNNNVGVFTQIYFLTNKPLLKGGGVEGLYHTGALTLRKIIPAHPK